MICMKGRCNKLCDGPEQFLEVA